MYKYQVIRVDAAGEILVRTELHLEDAVRWVRQLVKDNMDKDPQPTEIVGIRLI